MKLKIVVDKNLCIGAASCVTVSPAYFQLNNENKAVVVENGVSVEPDNRVYERVVEADNNQIAEIVLAAQSCPTTAVFVYNNETGERLYPLENI